MIEPIEQADEEWTLFNLREKIAAIDPDGEKELLQEFTVWNGSPHTTHSFLDDKYGPGWTLRRAQELQQLAEEGGLDL